MKNRFKSIIRTDRYGVKCVKNFTIWADGSVSLQRWDDINPGAIPAGLLRACKALYKHFQEEGKTMKNRKSDPGAGAWAVINTVCVIITAVLLAACAVALVMNVTCGF